MSKSKPKIKDTKPRFGIGEWYGHSLAQLSSQQRHYYAVESLKPKKDREPQPCPFQSRKTNATCTKEGGVCSLRLYSYGKHPVNGRAVGIPVLGKTGAFRATCPYRFHESLDVFHWVGETLLNNEDPKLVSEVGFLEAGATVDNEVGGDDVGRIDMVLVNPDKPGGSQHWTALEIQAVYFSGSAMVGEFKAYLDQEIEWIVFPAATRRPDYRSCGPKRLMPQLQIKVPTLRRWGKKMAVVVDRSFFDSIGEMDHVDDISNSDIAWFIVGFEETIGISLTRIVREEIRFTTLERAVEGLTGGKPVPLAVFENRIENKILSKESDEVNLLDLFSGIKKPVNLP
jgi:hypothetical protein